jgi:predicted pyridoxine 5'-phosphate oxidase superfamily flavin-nucleotide-binding protein
MSKLSSEMKSLFDTQLAIIATSSKAGVPNLGPKGSFYVIDDETLVYAEGTNEKTFRNLKENPQAAVIVVDRNTGNGYQFKGKAELLTGGEYFQKMVKRQEERKKPAPKLVVKIRVDEIYSLKPGATAKRIE